MSTKKKVLVVDDDHDTLDLIEVVLFSDYEIFTALNGFDGLNLAQQQIPDLIITDIMMPVMDGIRFINRLRKGPDTRSIPVIALTSFVEKNPVKSLLNMGFNDVVPKPFDKDDILKTVHAIIGGK
ncbi:MAG: response regulator [Chitinivibrionales bacterium]|nr:response regulator [Chitinivibrionales bacterium]